MLDGGGRSTGDGGSCRLHGGYTTIVNRDSQDIGGGLVTLPTKSGFLRGLGTFGIPSPITLTF